MNLKRVFLGILHQRKKQKAIMSDDRSRETNSYMRRCVSLALLSGGPNVLDEKHKDIQEFRSMR